MSRHSLLVTLLALALCHPVRLADDGNPAASEQTGWDKFTPLIEEFTTDYPADREFATVAIAVSHAGERRYWQVGNPIVADGEPVPSEATIYQIGSVTKTFTGLLLADMVEEGIVSLDTTIGDLKPADVELSEDMAGITLRELATHSSGLPRMTGELQVALMFDMTNPFATYSEEQVWNALEATTIPARDERGYVYSNLAMGLLGQLLADRMQTDYATLLQSRITEPLQLPDTVIQFFEDEQLARLARTHRRRQRTRHLDVRLAPAGCGALSSTTSDLLTYLEAEMNPDQSPLGPAIRLSQQSHYETTENELRIGLAWHMIPGTGMYPIFMHDGGTNGHTAFTGFIPETNTAVAILCNSGYRTLTGNHMAIRLGVKLLAASQPKSVETEEQAAATNPDE